MATWLGYRWLSERYGVTPVQPFRVDSQLAKSRTTERSNGFTHEFYTPQFKPEDTFAGHMTFALKREGVHLEFLARLFQVLPPADLDAWLADEPTGQYSRRTGFLYEWLTGNRLEFGGVGVGNYIDALDSNLYLTATNPENVPRWRVRNNMPGTRDYCPMVYRTDAVRAAEIYDCNQRLHDLEVEYGEDLIMRSAVWLTVKESQASFAIEREGNSIDKIKRFAAAMENHCGRYPSPLDPGAINELQREILGPDVIRQGLYGMRKSPVFIGETNSSFLPVVHYIAPHWDDTTSMLGGLQAFADRTAGGSPLARAAVLSFGFVYIHPMPDGNGRISRFLINDILRRDKAIPEPFILPVSATIISSTLNRRGYDQVLEVFSKPFMARYRDQYQFGDHTTAEDGNPYNLYFSGYADANMAWRYQDLTEHVEYLAHVVELTLEQEMHKEASYLRSMRSAREQIKEIIEGPDAEIDRIIRAISNNNYQVSNKLRKEFPLLEKAEIGDKLALIVQEAFAPAPPAEELDTEDDRPSNRPS
ncbi:Fic family protein [Herbaspirillum lusitanum]|uniref:Fic family protein n=1 Tax=Herbaspirillum lusitanum TaxID=213312 RepID=UPI002238C517|nr:Fic family protein [Herbaspirillum lusitanum]MCW5300117.1 Fic family protein [Herbaspirillum lusitanum]